MHGEGRGTVVATVQAINHRDTERKEKICRTSKPIFFSGLLGEEWEWLPGLILYCGCAKSI